MVKIVVGIVVKNYLVALSRKEMCLGNACKIWNQGRKVDERQHLHNYKQDTKNFYKLIVFDSGPWCIYRVTDEKSN